MSSMSSSHSSQHGIMMAMVIILMSISMAILVGLFSYVVSSSSFANDVVYRQVAQSAAKSALEYGKEIFDSQINFDLTDVNGDGTIDNDDNSNGIADPIEEKDMFQNAAYRTTYQLLVTPGGTSADGRSKKIQGIGRVYLPASATTPRWTKQINSEIIRSGIIAGSPGDFSPLAWYDASCNPDTSTELDCALPTVLNDGTASAAGNTISLREERQTDGVNCGGSPNTGDNRINMSHSGDCGIDVYQYTGMTFNFGSQLPKSVTITNATIQFTAACSQTSNARAYIFGITDPYNAGIFDSGTANQIRNHTHTTANVAWNIGQWNTVGRRGANERTPDIKTVIQEMINNPSWAEGDNLTLGTEFWQGPGYRCAQPSNITLSLTFNGNVAADMDESVIVWRDRSGNGFHMSAPDSGSRPVKRPLVQTPTASTPNGKPVVRFTKSSSTMSAVVPSSTGRTSNIFSMVALVNVKSTTDSSSTVSGNVVGMYGTGTGNRQLYPLWRHPATGFHATDVTQSTQSLCSGSRSSSGTLDMSCMTSGTNMDNWHIISDRGYSIERDTLLRIDGRNDPNSGLSEAKTLYTLNAPYTIEFNRNAFSNLRGTDSDVAEMILFDHELTCPQMETIEQYLAEKWGMNDSQLGSLQYSSSGCEENNIPSF